MIETRRGRGQRDRHTFREYSSLCLRAASSSRRRLSMLWFSRATSLRCACNTVPYRTVHYSTVPYEYSARICGSHSKGVR